jgi:hypothetical protein
MTNEAPKQQHSQRWLDLVSNAPLWAAVAAVGSVVAAIASVIAAYAAVAAVSVSQATMRSDQSARRVERVASQLQTYLQAYSSMIEMTKGDLSYCTYKKGDLLLQYKEQISAAMLLDLADRMADAGDTRATTWSAFLTNFQGPLHDPDFHLENYASSPTSNKILLAARNDTKVGAKSLCPAK